MGARGSRRRALRVPSGSRIDRKSTRLNSSHLGISYAVFFLKKEDHAPLCLLPASSIVCGGRTLRRTIFSLTTNWYCFFFKKLAHRRIKNLFPRKAPSR